MTGTETDALEPMAIALWIDEATAGLSPRAVEGWHDQSDETQARWRRAAGKAFAADPLRRKLGPAAVEAIMAGRAAMVETVARCQDTPVNPRLAYSFDELGYVRRVPRLDRPAE